MSRERNILGAVVLSVATACTPQVQSERTFSLDIEGLPADQRIGAQQAAVEWDSRFDCGRDVEIVPLGGRTDETTVFTAEGFKTTLNYEIAEPGRIMLGKIGDARNITLHAMTHACKPDQPTLLDTPLEYVDGIIRGFHGGEVLITTHEGKETKITLIEEAMAERNASVFPGYEISNLSYYEMGVLALTELPFDTYPNAHEWIQRNDVPAIVRAILGLRSNANISGRQIEKVMRMFNDAWDRGASQ